VPVLAVVTLSSLAATAEPAVAAAAVSALYPDMRTLPPRELKLDRADVSLDGSGALHNLLRFSNTVYNAGQGPLILNAVIDAVTRSGPATQRVMNDDGSFTDYPAGSFYWHEAHQHYHFDGWGTYQLWLKADYDKWVASNRSAGQAKKVGAKTTSCVLDEEFITTLPATPFPGQYYGGCLPVASGQLRQVLSPGWGDTYDYWRAEQWIDLDQETLADGQYVLRSVSDPTNLIYESSNKSDATREGQVANEGLTTFTISGGQLLDSAPPTGTVTINHVDASTQSTAVSVDVIGRDDVSGVDQFRLSDDATTWATFPYTSGDGSVPTTVAWDLADIRYGGTGAGGDRLVYAQTHDVSGKWSSTFTDSINLMTTPPPPKSGYGGVVAADGPVSYWRLGEATGTAALDSAGVNLGTYRNGVTLGAGSLTADTTNTAATFDGVNDAMSVASTAALSPAGALTVEAWIHPAAKPAAGAFASVVTKAEAYSLQFNGPQLEFTTVQGAARRRVQAAASTVVVGQTYHVVGTFDGATQRLYVNGVQVASGLFSGPVNVTTTPVVVGSWDAASEFLAGTVDDVAVYAKVLSPAQVTTHYTQGTSTTPPPPPPAQRSLLVTRAGTGSGTITSAFPVGINCGSVCTTTVTDGMVVTLSAASAPGSTFGGWTGGGCTGTKACITTVTADTTVTATFTAVVPPPTAGYGATVIADGPTSFWRLAEATGTAAADSAGPNTGVYRNGVTTGVAGLTSDTANMAASFDGVNDMVSVPSSPGLSPTAAVTVEAWVRPTTKPAAGAFASVVTKAEAYSLQFNGPQLEFTTIQGITRRRVQAPASAIVVGGTYHVVGTYDGTTQRLYVNGVQVASGAFSGAVNANASPVLLGSWDAASEFLAGTIDDVAVYAKSLSAAQVSSHYGAGRTT
jgi:hypothetical protein